MPIWRPRRLCRCGRLNAVLGCLTGGCRKGCGMRYLAMGLVYVYRWIFSPLVGNRCKYHPSCSQYALDALREYGFFKGSILAGWRLLRCNPWSHGGVDYAKDQKVFT